MAITAAQGEVIATTPFLVKRWEGITTAASHVLTHGEDRSPDLLFVVGYGVAASNVGTTYDGRTTSDTTCTIKCEDVGNDTVNIIAVWFTHATGGLTNVS